MAAGHEISQWYRNLGHTQLDLRDGGNGSRDERKRGKLIFIETPHVEDDQAVQLGRNLAAAFIATCQGISLDYARKKYAGESVGEYWIALARRVITDMSKRSVQPERTPTIQ